VNDLAYYIQCVCGCGGIGHFEVILTWWFYCSCR